MEYLSTPMMRQIESVPSLYSEINTCFEERARRLFTNEELLSLKKITLTGCGDSYCAAEIGSIFLETLTDLDCRCRTSIDLSRTVPRWQIVSNNGSAAVIGVSVSGAVTRVAEAMERAKRLGAISIGLTGTLDSLVGRSATHVLNAGIPLFEWAPGVRSYCASLLMLFHLAVRIGEVRGTLSPIDATSLRSHAAALPDVLERELPRMLDESEMVVKSLAGAKFFEFLGTGTSFYTSWFGMAKTIETIGAPCVTANTEDWFHMQYFSKALDKTAVCVVTNAGGRANDREEELIREIRLQKRPFWLVTDRDDLVMLPHIRTPKLAEMLLDPLVQCLPVAAVASLLCSARNERYLRDTTGAWGSCADYVLIANGELHIAED